MKTTLKQLLHLLICTAYAALALIRTAGDLECSFEGALPCAGWRNGTDGVDDQNQWKVASLGVLLDPWHSIPRAFHGEQFTYVLGGNLAIPQFAWLTSDTIPCLLVPGYLTFHYWKNTFLSGLFATPLPRLQVFIQRYKSKESSQEALGQPPTTHNLKIVADFNTPNSWGWRFAAVEIPVSSEPFQIVIQAEFQGAFDIVAVDDIIFRGLINEGYCNLTQTERRQLLQSVTTVAPRAFSQSTRLPSDASTGLFGSPPGPKLNEVQQLLAERPDLRALMSALPTETAQQVSRVLLNQQSPTSTLPTTATPSFFQGTNNNSPTRALAALLTQQQQRQTSIPSSLIEWLEQSRGRGFDVENEPTALPSSVNKDGDLSTPIVNYTNECPAVNCGFENDACAYEGTDDALGAWVIVQGRIGNPITGISRAAFGRFYSVAYTNDGTSTQVLRSAEFVTEKQSFLTFWYYFANANAGRLVVCDQRLDNCFWEKTTEEVSAASRRWRRAAVVLPPGSHQIMFVIEDLSENYFVGIDEIYLRRQLNGDTIGCSTTV